MLDSPYYFECRRNREEIVMHLRSCSWTFVSTMGSLFDSFKKRYPLLSSNHTWTKKLRHARTYRDDSLIDNYHGFHVIFYSFKPYVQNSLKIGFIVVHLYTTKLNKNYWNEQMRELKIGFIGMMSLEFLFGRKRSKKMIVALFMQWPYNKTWWVYN